MFFNKSKKKSKSTRTGYSIYLYFSITQHNRNRLLMTTLENYFGCGKFSYKPGNSYGEFKILSLKDIQSKIIPFFDKYPIVGDKNIDYTN